MRIGVGVNGVTIGGMHVVTVSGTGTIDNSMLCSAVNGTVFGNLAGLGIDDGDYWPYIGCVGGGAVVDVDDGDC